MKRTRNKKKLLIIIAAAVVVVLGGGALARSTMHDKPGETDDHSSHKRADETQPVNDQPVPVAFDKSQHSLDQPASMWVVSNKLRPLQPNNYAPNDLVSIGGGQQMRSEAASAYIKLRDAAAVAGHTISAQSGYRSYNTQVATYNRWVSELGKAEADRQSARPGHSEHQTGLALDVGGDGCNIEECFGSKPSGIWVAEHAHEYGFIIRYPQGKEHVTGYLYEPWHLRYVGRALATEMKRTGAQTMEEFFGLPSAPNYN